MCNFEVYTGASPGNNIQAEGGLGPSVVKNLTAPFRGKGHWVFYDNFFSTVGLADSLLQDKIYSCGTARANRREYPSCLRKVALKRGESSSIVLDSNIECLVWCDKKDVYFINSICDPEDMSEVKRRNKDGSQSLISCPGAVKIYNAFMGGVDLADFKRKTYSCSRRAGKWWHRLFYFILDVCIVNAHILQSTTHQSCMTQKHFRLELAREMLSCHNSHRGQKRGRRSFEGSPSAQTSEQHYPDKLPLQCRVCSHSQERKRTLFCCTSCNATAPVPLCVYPCFKLHHTN